MIYGGWGRCNMVRLKNDFTGVLPFPDGTTYKEITPKGYVEGPFMFIRQGKYYFMWSEGNWGGPDYRVAYAVANSPFGPFERIGTVLQQDPKVATGAGHHSVMQVPGKDEWYMVYHRRPLTETDANHRVTCIDYLSFDEKGFIKPVKITQEGVARRPLK
jgi:beta-xylosidase